MKKMLFSDALAILLTRSAHKTFTVGNNPTAVNPKETFNHNFFTSVI
ncbi:lipoprotein bor, partial [Escherichia coli]|nr:lipoprotein bor [Escherichia coli]